MKKILRTITTVAMAVLLCITAFAHGGRTDSNGGHKDNHNISGLGKYHYHCDGHPAHLHEDGVCPYAIKTKAETKSTETKAVSTTKSSKQTSNKPIQSAIIGAGSAGVVVGVSELIRRKK